MRADTRARSFRTHVRLALVIACASTLSFACGAKRDGATPGVADRPIVRIATSGDYPPFSQWPEDASTPQGFAPDLLRAWASSTGRRIEWLRFRWPDLTLDTSKGRFDLAAGGITIRSDRSIVGTFGIPLATSGAVALVRPGTVTTLDALDREDVRIAVNRGGHLERVTRHRFRRATPLPTAPNAAVPARLASGEVEAAVSDTREAPLWRADHPKWIVLGPFTRDRKAVLAAPGKEGLLAALDDWLLGPIGGHTLDALRLQHLGDDPRSAHVTALDALLAAMDERLALMPDVARYKQAKGLAIEAPDRETKVLVASWIGVKEAASKADTRAPDRPDVEAFFRAQIEAAKQVQRRTIGEPGERGKGGEATIGPVPDLDAELRPALLRIGARIARLLVELSEDDTHDLRARIETALARSDLSSQSLDTISQALTKIAQTDQ